jgi:hypothetical protein
MADFSRKNHPGLLSSLRYFFAAATVSLFFTGCNLVEPSDKIYLTSGGVDYYVLRKEWFQPLQVHLTRAAPLGRGVEKDAGSLIFWPLVGTSPEVEFRLVPSATVKKDWDLTQVRIYGNSREVDYLQENCPSCLHFIDDARIATFFEELERYWSGGRVQGEEARHYRTAIGLLGKYPDDPWLRNLYLHAALDGGELAEVARRLQQWRPEMRVENNAILMETFSRAEKALEARQLSRDGGNAWDAVQDLIQPGKNLEGRVAALPALVRYEQLASPRSAFQPALNAADLESTIEAAQVQILFHLFQGKRIQALNLAVGCYYLGNLLLTSEEEFHCTLGHKIQEMTLPRLKICALDGWEPGREPDELLEKLALLTEISLNQLKRGSIQLKEPVFFNSTGLHFNNNAEQTLEQFRRRIVELSQLYLAAAARQYRGESGEFPSVSEDLAPRLPGPWPEDPYADGPIRVFGSPTKFVIYSIGPDRVNQYGRKEYDPKGGEGDLIFQVRFKRKYPFPVGGVRGYNRSEILDLFPEGLPEDPFMVKMPGSGERQIQVSNTRPVYLYSPGPDLDVDTGPEGVFHSTLHYDPVNGIQSNGDLFVEIQKY